MQDMNDIGFPHMQHLVTNVANVNVFACIARKPFKPSTLF